MISVIIPIYNEESILKANSSFLSNLALSSELIFVDGKSTDNSKELAGSIGKLIVSDKGRAFQMNRGASEAEGEILLFLHSDNTITPTSIKSIEDAIGSGCIGGCLSQRIDDLNYKYRLIETLGNVRGCLTKVFYGDQAIFIKRSVFNKIGGFPSVPIMEDVIFSKRMRKEGKVCALNDKVVVSARRWVKKGILNTAALYCAINILFYLKVPLKYIKRIYTDLR